MVILNLSLIAPVGRPIKAKMEEFEVVRDPQSDPILPYTRLMQAVIIQAMKDYINDRSERKFIKRWVKKMNGTFKLCCEAWGRTPEEVQKMMLEKMKEIDHGKPLVVNLKKTRR